MSFRDTQANFRQRYLAMYDADGTAKYDTWVEAMSDEDHDACIADLKHCVAFSNNMQILDVGSGTGALCLALARIPELDIVALEPSSSMIDLLEKKPKLRDVRTVQGFCDHADDAAHFAPATFDLICSRLLVNNLFDPLAAFRNWNAWLRPGGRVVVMDGLFDRSDWKEDWTSFVDNLPLSACRTTATVPYLLEQTGFQIEHVGWMDCTNAMPSTRTRRYIVVAQKTSDAHERLI